MSDLINRRAALDAFGLSEKTRKYGGDHSGYDTRMLYEIQDTLENLPAVQPDHVADISKKVSISCGHENDMISRQAAIALAKDICVPMGDGRVYRTRSIDPQEVRELPAVQLDLSGYSFRFWKSAYEIGKAEIIRCRDCRFNDGTAYCVFHFRDVKGEDYCSWGERRIDETD